MPLLCSIAAASRRKEGNIIGEDKDEGGQSPRERLALLQRPLQCSSKLAGLATTSAITCSLGKDADT